MFGLRTTIFMEIPGIFLEIRGNSKTDPPKIGCEVEFGRRGSLEVIESTSFSSKTAFPDPPDPPGGLPDPPDLPRSFG